MSTEIVPVNAEVVRRDDRENFMPALSIEDAIRRKQAIVEFVAKLMVVDKDFGIVPGSSKPTLLKPGAEKLCSYFGLIPRYTAISVTRDWTGVDHGGEPFFEFDYKCQLVRLADQDSIVGEGDGSCNSWETKYRYRENKRVCPACGKDTIIKGKAEYGGGFICFTKKGGCGAKYADKDPAIINQQVGRIPNPDIFDQVNTLEKMSQKRSLIGACLNAVNASEFFTQDFGDPETDAPSHWGDSGSQEAANAAKERTIEQLKQGKDYRSIKEEAGALPPRDAPPVEVVAPSSATPKTFSMGKSIAEFEKLKKFAVEMLGDKGSKIYYEILGRFGFEHSNQIKQAKSAREVYRTLNAELTAAMEYAKRDEFEDDMATEARKEAHS